MQGSEDSSSAPSPKLSKFNKAAQMIKIPINPRKKVSVPEELQNNFYSQKEVRMLPLSILRALNKKPKNLFMCTPSSTDEATTVLENEVLSDFRDKVFR